MVSESGANVISMDKPFPTLAVSPFIVAFSRCRVVQQLKTGIPLTDNHAVIEVSGIDAFTRHLRNGSPEFPACQCPICKNET